VSVDGAAYEWSLQSFSKVEDHVVKGCAYTATVYNDTGNGIIAAGLDFYYSKQHQHQIYSFFFLPQQMIVQFDKFLVEMLFINLQQEVMLFLLYFSFLLFFKQINYFSI